MHAVVHPDEASRANEAPLLLTPVLWEIGHSTEALSPGPANRVRVEVVFRGRPLAEFDLPALGTVSASRADAWLISRLAYAPLRRTLTELRPWTSRRFWFETLRSLATVRGLGLRQQARRRRLNRGILKAHLKYALARGVIAALPARRAHEGCPAGPGLHASELAAMKAELGWSATLGPDERTRPVCEEALDPGDTGSAEGWDAFFRGREDPWNYRESAYERRKYEETLELLEHDAPPVQAIELGCAEGLFTEMLAPRVGDLLATDISGVALERAAGRCSLHGNVRFQALDFVSQELGGPYNLIVCSEALYYAPSRRALEATVAKLVRNLAPGGRLLTTNANQVADDPEHSGFDWGAEFGSRTIGEMIGSTPGLSLEREIETPLYRVQLFRKGHAGSTALEAARESRTLSAPLEPQVAASVLYHGGVSRVRALHTELSASLPILMYHRVAEDGPEALVRFKISPRLFAEHVEFLRRSGYTSVTPGQWRAAQRANRPMPGRPVMITFDDGYRDLETNAWPILKRRDFTATVFVVTDHVGGRAEWDAAYGEPAPLMSWDSLRGLAGEGLEVGSHGATHRKMSQLPTREIYLEALRSRRAIEAELGVAPRIFCYPHGDYDTLTPVALSECGYEMAFSCASGPSTLTQDPFALSRVEVTGEDDVDVLAAKLGIGRT